MREVTWPEIATDNEHAEVQKKMYYKLYDEPAAWNLWIEAIQDPLEAVRD